ncbi:hypothetical protein Slash_7 [Bacillus phage Slash]|uniref:Uncharacterized protein n=2 Tax=Slashvirus TaxID=1921709 RepID=U5PXG3_9CAUD|nr:hypothetical protein Staley_7 [Bacillus phage Staley]YP_008771909.1 hypothetical protein Slash_7 [Bacillus phage Slash]AGY48296.1 hypothetical protein Slash_7 [Bacillus phage Slash]AGY48690.1 hypothetical protein Staley_7 [Bacillus phage Staley]
MNRKIVFTVRDREGKRETFNCPIDGDLETVENAAKIQAKHYLNEFVGAVSVSYMIVDMLKYGVVEPDQVTPQPVKIHAVSLAEKCGGCRFYDTKQKYCNEHGITREFEDNKCNSWRYFA